jgi:hypothetical protein
MIKSLLDNEFERMRKEGNTCQDTHLPVRSEPRNSKYVAGLPPIRCLLITHINPDEEEILPQLKKTKGIAFI